MRTRIDVDEALLHEAMAATGQKTGEAAIEAALRDAVQISRQRLALERLRGAGWEGDLDQTRHDFFRATAER